MRRGTSPVRISAFKGRKSMMAWKRFFFFWDLDPPHLPARWKVWILSKQCVFSFKFGDFCGFILWSWFFFAPFWCPFSLGGDMGASQWLVAALVGTKQWLPNKWQNIFRYFEQSAVEIPNIIVSLFKIPGQPYKTWMAWVEAIILPRTERLMRCYFQLLNL